MNFANDAYVIDNPSDTKVQYGPHPGQLERRAHKRLPLRSRALIGVPGNAAIRCQTVDFSAAGLGILSPIKLTPGEECCAFFTLELNEQLAPISTQAKVVNCVKFEEGYRVGLRLCIADRATRILIDQFLGEHSA